MKQLELTAIKRAWIDDCAPRLTTMLPQLGEFTSDELHRIFPAPDHPNWFGVLLANSSALDWWSALATGHRPEKSVTVELSEFGRHPMLEPTTDRFSQPLFNEGRDLEADQDVEEEKADMDYDRERNDG